MSAAGYLIDSSAQARIVRCPVTEVEFLHSARNADHCKHRSAGAVDLLVAATAELQGLTVLHYDNDFGL